MNNTARVAVGLRCENGGVLAECNCGGTSEPLAAAAEGVRWLLAHVAEVHPHFLDEFRAKLWPPDEYCVGAPDAETFGALMRRMWEAPSTATRRVRKRGRP